MKKIDMFKANRVAADRVAEFVDKTIVRKNTIVVWDNDIKAIKTRLANLENLAGSVLDTTAKREELWNDLQATQELKAKALEELDKFELTEYDKAFTKALRNKSCDDFKSINNAIEEWARALCGEEFDIKDTNLLKSIKNAIGGKESMAQLVKNGNALVIDSSKALRNAYWVVYNYMVAADTIKESKIPDTLKAKYDKKFAKELVAKAMEQ